ncbi:MAG: thioredoxin domain-containing protein [Candidatus Acidiferrales bacterium]
MADSAAAAQRLARSASPYLRSAAHQPVEWYEWGDEAFARARAEDRPILLDIGAVWCHWCHVIDRESYENPEIAAIINKLFIAVKVDRDERPDVDARYQTAISAVSGQGGWPLTGFLLPDGRPFFGGTYFPPNDMGGRPGFGRVLATMADAFRTRRKEVDEAAEALSSAVARAESFEGAAGTFDAAVVDRMVDSIAARFDPRDGGFGRSPKFPHPSALDLILDRCQVSSVSSTSSATSASSGSTSASELLNVAKFTLEHMARGGVYDQLAGGFHRYSVDEHWRVPHFEKMSYDNSELLKNYLHGYQVTREPLFREVAESIIGWVTTTLSDQEHGGFYASQDADQTLDDDGDYFTWTLEELRAALDADEARVAELFYGVEPVGQMHHNPLKNTLCRAAEPAEIARELNLAEPRVAELLASAKQKLLAVRAKRDAPFVDTTCYVSWNAMFCSAFLEAARVLGNEQGQRAGQFALRTLDRILDETWGAERGFAHRFGGGPRLDGSLDDQVCTAAALLDAYELTLIPRYFEAARRGADVMIAQFADAAGGGFFDRSSAAAPLGGLDVRRKPFQDSPTPGGNAAAAILLDRLYEFTGDQRYLFHSTATLNAFAKIAPDYGLHAATYGLAALLHERGALQIVITGPALHHSAQQLERVANASYRFGKVALRVLPDSATAAALPPALAETLPHLNADVSRATVCVGTSCQPPIDDPAELKALLVRLA